MGPDKVIIVYRFLPMGPNQRARLPILPAAMIPLVVNKDFPVSPQFMPTISCRDGSSELLFAD